MASERARDQRRDTDPVHTAQAATASAPQLTRVTGELLRMQATGGNAMVIRLLREAGLIGAPPGEPAVAERIRGRLGRGESLPEEVREQIAPAVEAPLGEVRLHRDAEAAGLTRELGARAFTTGADVFFAAGAYEPGTRRGSALLAHELTHTTQVTEATGTAGLLHVTDPGDATEVAAEAAAHRVGSSWSAAPPGRPAGPVARAALTVARQPAGGTPAPPASAGVPEQYASIVTPSLSEADTRMLQQATGGADLVESIRRRNAIRLQLAVHWPEPSNDPMDAGVRENLPGGVAPDYGQLEKDERELTSRIDAELAQLGVSSDAELLELVQERFPTRFLAEAKKVALDMLNHNKDQANGELERYSAQVCSPDIDGLLAADRELGELDPAPIEISIHAAESALSKYGPAAGVLTPDQFAQLVPENEQSVMVDIANLDSNRRLLEQRRAIYNNVRFTYGRRYPILLDGSYRPGTYAAAPPEELGKLVAKPVAEILENIDRVEKAIENDDLKVWNMRDVLRITQERLQVTHPVLLASIEARIRSIQADEAFMGWVIAALAITTSVVAGILFTPATGAAVAAAWTLGSMAGHIDDMLNETAANNIALDERVADLSLNEPTIVWILVDALSLGLDLGAVAKALRPTARLLAAQGDALALQAFRRAAANEFGEEAAGKLAAKAAARQGIELAGAQAAEEQLRFAATVLADLNLSEDALARIVAKGADVSQLKGQIFEEMMNTAVARELASGSSAALGAADTAGLELIEGSRISDLAGRQLTDGMVVRRMADGSLEIASVLEAKAGRAAAQGLHQGSHGLGDPEEFARFVIEENRNGVIGALRKAGLDKDADLVAKGGETLSEEAIAAVTKDKSLRRTVTQAELGGQVRTDTERLAPGVSSQEGLPPHLDETPTQILIDGVPTTVRMSPTRTQFVGAVPQDVPTDAITKALRQEGFSFQPMSLDKAAADLTSRAQRIADNATRAAASTTPAAPTAP